MDRIRNLSRQATRVLPNLVRSFATFLQRMGIPLLILGVGIIIVYFAAQQFFAWRYAASTIPEVDKRIQAENEAFRTLAQILGATFFLVTAYFTWRTVRASEETVRAAQQNIAVSLEGQITDRFTKAIEQLGDTTNLAKRLGGTYALERIAKDSPKDHWTIMEVLTAYVRENAPWKEEQEQPELAIPKEAQQDIRPPSDIQAILTVLGRRILRHEKEENHLDLHRTDLRGVNLFGAHLERANLSGAHLEEANLWGAHLERAYLLGAHLERARLTKAQLEEAILPGAHLEEANLLEAHLERTNLLEAHLEGANLFGAHLEEAIFSGAHLEGAILSGAHLEGAILSGARLTGVVNLTYEQLHEAITDEATQLPDYLKIPPEQKAVGRHSAMDVAGADYAGE